MSGLRETANVWGQLTPTDWIRSSQVLQNAYLRIGDGSQASISQSASAKPVVQQIFYKSAAGVWTKLTYGTKDMDLEVKVRAHITMSQSSDL